MRIISSTHLRLGLIGLALFVVLGANDQGFRSIFDGTSGKGWILCDGKPLPKAFVQPEGLNPHGTGSYLVVHDTKAGDFVLDFDYKLTKGCNSGVFIRVSDLNDPVNTGIEVALDDTTGSGMHDPGGVADPTGLQVLKKCRVSGRRHFCHPTSFQGRGCENGRSTEDPASGS